MTHHHINCTLTDAEWNALALAIDFHFIELGDQSAYQDEQGGRARKQAAALDRAFRKLKGEDRP